MAQGTWLGAIVGTTEDWAEYCIVIARIPGVGAIIQVSGNDCLGWREDSDRVSRRTRGQDYHFGSSALEAFALTFPYGQRLNLFGERNS